MERHEEIQRLREVLQDVNKRLRALERLDVQPPVSSIVTYSGTPTAGRLAQFAGGGTVTETSYPGSAVVQYSGVPTAGAIPYFTGGAGTVAPASFGTANVVLTSGAQTVAGAKSFTSALTVLTASAGQTLTLGSNATENSGTTRRTRIGAHHFDLGEEPIAVFQSVATSTENQIAIGGNSTIMNAATLIDLYLASNNTTITGTRRFRFVPAGLGIGVDDPQGRLHIHNGTLGFLVTSKTGVVGSSQVIIPDGTGDVTRAIYGIVILTDGTSGVANSFSMVPGDNTDIAMGGSTWRIALNANGELSTIRTLGTGTASIALALLWI